ncbi:protein translocase subunit yidC [Rhizobiales bacterium GAS113]|nr:protein translocase subunit yidC [Rhizobiales bacterium GAS113]
MDDKRNLFTAIGLSLLVLIGWQYFVTPRFITKPAPIEAQDGKTVEGKTVAAPEGTPPVPATPGAPAAPAAVVPGAAPQLARGEALKASPRVAIRNGHLAGSIALKGARIDDLTLTSYRETPDPASPNIVLFSPSHTEGAFYADFGLLPGANGAAGDTPGADTLWQANGAELTPATPLTLTWTNPQGVEFKREIGIDDNYMFSVTDTVTNRGPQALTVFPYAAVVRQGTPQVSGYYVLHEGLVGYIGNVGLEEWTYAKLDKEGVKSYAGSGGFVGITDKYWAAAVIPDQSKSYDARFVATTTGAKAYQADLREGELDVAPGASATTSSRLFAGAKVVQLVDNYQQQLGIKSFDLIIDWGWFYFITKPLFKVIDYFYKLLGNFGLAILLVTVLLKTLFFPLANKSYASMAKMKAVQPQLKELQERNKDDKAKLQQEMMALYKREKINPVAGCWPMLIQIPVFFALYKVIFTTIEMRQAPFYGWIHDLSAPDPTSVFNLFGLIPLTLPHFLVLGAWPLIMGVTMFVQMKMNPEPPDPAQKMMFTWMPLIFTFMLSSFPAGLVIYWSWNNTLSVLQQGFIMKKHGVKIELWDNLRKLIAGKSSPSTA